MTKKMIFIYVSLFLVIAGILLLLIYGILHQRQQGQNTGAIPAPTIYILQPTPIPAVYPKSASDTIINKVEERQSLSDSDAQAKTTLLESKDATKDTIYETENFKVDYVNPPDIFQVEILSDDAESAKTDAVQWFYLQGFSQQALCNLPVQFYLTGTVLQDYKAANKSFSEVAPGC